MTKKEYIKRYFKLKLQSGEWQANDRVLSENQIAIKFNCSRITARQSIQPFVFSGVLTPKKGVGYIISDHYKNIGYKSISEKYSPDHIEIKPLCDIDQEIKNELNIQKKDNVIYFIKNYYKNNKIIIKQLTAVNKEMILEVNYEGFKKSINKEFSLNGLLVEKVLMNFKQKIDKKLKNSLKIIDYDENKYVLEKFFSYSNYYWLEKTFRIIKKELLNETFLINIF